MKWIKDIRTDTKAWLKNLFRWSENTVNEFDETIMINDCFSTYLQKIVADKLKPAPDPIVITKTTPKPADDLNIKQPDQSIRALSPLKQII
ncbi:hypothetical protein [Acetobacterium woodii]|uniref:Uncharacterized protein n=1 Tax=Acetobacterium woodii (strain ATCC 29683 / DSM 1030 / JCM 2381 / KCTC 1655 / WB1) TaxID=931626 RepID=H6LD82_ACEWD|nr:hypothetical protein [Acetobacterium woodii]AFA49127.1 hypothetical protein Awo_c23540 [Acetobacterium woodii DSM 1030]